jgi:hypothetical protein
MSTSGRRFAIEAFCAGLHALLVSRWARRRLSSQLASSCPQLAAIQQLCVDTAQQDAWLPVPGEERSLYDCVSFGTLNPDSVDLPTHAAAPRSFTQLLHA